MFADALLLPTADLPATHWKRLGEHLPYESIEDALAYSGRASIRKRRLPAQQEDPLAWLFTTSARAWFAQDGHRNLSGGLRLLAMDGTSLKLADSAANREHFGAPHFAAGAVASYPHARMVTLTALSTQLVLAAQLGPLGLSEKALTLQLLDEIPDHSLTVLDKGFMSAQLMGKLRCGGQERHFSYLPSPINAGSSSRVAPKTAW